MLGIVLACVLYQAPIVLDLSGAPTNAKEVVVICGSKAWKVPVITLAPPLPPDPTPVPVPPIPPDPVTPGPVPTPTPDEFGLIGPAKEDGLKDKAIAAKLYPVFASAAKNFAAYVVPNEAGKLGHDRVQEYLGATWDAADAVASGNARGFLVKSLVRFAEVRDEGLLADDAGFWDVTRYAGCYAEMAAGLYAAGVSGGAR